MCKEIEMTVMEFQAKKIERIAEALAHYVATTREDRLTWEVPGEGEAKGRSALDMVSECVVTNKMFAALLRGETPDVQAARANAPTFTDAETANAQLIASGKELGAAVRALTDADLARIFPFWRGPVTGEVLIEGGYRNMVYHGGQINFIQCLYGDAEFHVPPTWMN
jgi:hypothetical protein